MADSVKPSDINVFLSDAAWAIRSTYHTVLKASLDAAIFGQDSKSLKVSLLQQPLISTWATIPLDWIQMHPKSAQSSSLGVNTHTRDCQWE
jgi:hypothetical protein